MRRQQFRWWAALACCSMFLSACAGEPTRRGVVHAPPEKRAGYLLYWNGAFGNDVSVVFSRDAGGRPEDVAVRWNMWNLASGVRLGAFPSESGSPGRAPFAVRWPLAVPDDQRPYYFTLYVEPAGPERFKLLATVRPQRPSDDEWSLINRGRELTEEELAAPREGAALRGIDVDLSSEIVQTEDVDLKPIVESARGTKRGPGG